MSEVSSETEVRWEEIDRKYIQKKNNVSHNLENLSDDAKEEFQKLQDKYEIMKKKARSSK